IVILGAPNAGKSSLLNALARRDAAIVSERAGTTRDVIEVHLDIAGYPAILADTAGIRQSTDAIEEEGVRRALARAGEADIKLVLFDGADWPRRDPASLTLLDDRAITVIAKSDLLSSPVGGGIALSARTGRGIGDLLKALENRIISSFSGESAPLITRARHRALLTEALHALGRSVKELPLELKCEELRQAACAVGKITGQIRVDDVLDIVFKEFCIGK
ncbi:MAG: 50S ribosome-binding GTPase, partial [Pseudomonadota bacterium]|nr:50S ribosome-binding GTPase [Pseudomonadota bacterium]